MNKKMKMNAVNIYTIGLFWGIIWILAGVVSYMYNRTWYGEARQFLWLGIGSIVTVITQFTHTNVRNLTKNK